MGVRENLLRGAVIPAHPLALDLHRKLDERRQRALTRYYAAAGAGGVAVGVHTTQFAIRDAGIRLLRPVLEIAMEELRGSPLIKISGVCGPTDQAVREAELARSIGYEAVLLSMSALAGSSVDRLLDHARVIADIIPIIGFYLQPKVGGCTLPYEFWLRLTAIQNLVAIKIAPFDRYRTLDVLRAVADSGRDGEIALYTGNDDNILGDLLTTFHVGKRPVRIVGGLLGHWAVWTSKAVGLLRSIQKSREDGYVPAELMTLASQITDSNAAIFDAQNDFAGCIAGVHEILRRQGLLEGRWCLDPSEDLSAGQAAEIERVCQAYPHLQDDEFVAEHLDEWLR
jgi:dihydrodipicolinate synthase/N-acetylneuraminate lyase